MKLEKLVSFWDLWTLLSWSYAFAVVGFVLAVFCFSYVIWADRKRRPKPNRRV